MFLRILHALSTPWAGSETLRPQNPLGQPLGCSLPAHLPCWLRRPALCGALSPGPSEPAGKTRCFCSPGSGGVFCAVAPAELDPGLAPHYSGRCCPFWILHSSGHGGRQVAGCAGPSPMPSAQEVAWG